VAYDTKTVLDRYKQMQSLPEGEADESTCPLIRGSTPEATLGCESDGCQSCCVGIVEVLRQFNEQCTAPDDQSSSSEDPEETGDLPQNQGH
jgi:hypothetical protein